MVDNIVVLWGPPTVPNGVITGMYTYMYIRMCIYMYIQVAAGFSQFSKNIPKPFLMYNVACMLCSVAPQRETQLHAHGYEYIEYFTQCGSSPDGEELQVDP